MNQINELALPKHKPFYRRLKRWQWIVMIVILAASTRLWAAWQLPVDADEPTYLKAGQEYASLIKAGDWGGILRYDYNQEHPALVKLMYSLPYLLIEPRFGIPTEMMVDRVISVVWGVLAVLILSLIDPLAGIFLATDTMVIKYTSQVYLESFPLFAGLLAIYAFRRFSELGGRRNWFWISAVMIGAAVAGKYLYGLLGVPILVMFFRSKPRQWRYLGGFLLAALAAFFALDPALWLDPLGRLAASLSFHLNYTTSSLDIIRENYPWYQALNWITEMVPWHPQVFFFPGPDVLIFGLALIGAYGEWRHRTWSVVWAATTFLVLLVWPTKWPQYTLMLIPALCLMAALGLRQVMGWVIRFEENWNLYEAVLPHPGKEFWIPLTLVVAALLVGKLGYEIGVAQNRVGWSTVQTGVSPLPANSIHDLTIAKDGRMAIATDQGVAFWRSDERSPWGETPELLNPANSGLVNARVLRLIQDRSGAWWFGTETGLSRWDGNQGWKTYHAADLGLGLDQILSLLQDDRGRIWVGTKAGASVFNGSTWQSITTANSGLNNDAVFAMAEQTTRDGSWIWFGTLKGACRFAASGGEWQCFDLSQSGFGWAGVSDILVDQAGKVWVATLGDGLSVWDGQTWHTFRTTNSQIPLNSVSRILETQPGVYWLSMSYSSTPGGMLVRFIGNDWRSYDPSNSGYNGYEATALAFDDQSQLWIGTVINGLQIYQVSTTK